VGERAGVGQGKREGRDPAGERGREQAQRRKRGEVEVTKYTDSGQHHPTTVDGENSCSLRESGSLKDSNEWLKEWHC